MAPDSSEHTVVVHVMPGEILDERWRIETRIGQGAMGSVFRGKDLDENRQVAIKILAPEHCRKPKVLARFEREAELMLTIRHPNIVQLYGHGRRGALPYIAMEYLEGLTLAEVLQQLKGSMKLPETVAVVKQIASGLAFLHHYGLVHRDVKPQNVFLTAKGRITILDLGVVRDQANPGLTRPGAMVGTPYYMSPEQILGLEDIDRRTDVYALAAMTFELLTGRPPFLGANNFEVLYAHRNTPPPDASQLVKVSKSVAQVLMRGMAKRREERPESASELAADLEAASGVRRVDLSKAFPFIEKKNRHDKKPTAPMKTRIVPKLTPKDSEEVPLVHDDEVVSVPNAMPQEVKDTTDPSHTLETATLVGISIPDLVRVRDAAREHTHTGPAPAARTGHLKVQVLARGRTISAAVSVDQTPRGPTAKSISLSAGRHTIRITAPGYKAAERIVDVVGGAVVNLKVELQPG